MTYLRFVIGALFAAVLALALPAAAADSYATKDDAVALVQKAIARVAEVGMDRAKGEFMDRHDRFVDRDLYLVIIDRQGLRAVHGQNPKLVGKLYFDAVDVNGKEYGQDVQRIIEGPGKGWVSFAFKDPITGKILPKENYVEKAGDYTYLAGIYTR